MNIIEEKKKKNANDFTTCVEKKIAELSEKYKSILEEKEIDLIKHSYLITYETPQKGKIGYERIVEISPEIDCEIDFILKECSERLLK